MDPAEPKSTKMSAMPSRHEFDEDGYLQLHPDIALGVARGMIESGWSHFARAGFAEGRSWLTRPDPFAGVSREIAPGDEMFIGNEAHYFDVGESALHCVETAIATARRHRSTIRRILDLPCGHGRVLRFLRRAFPEAGLVACDLHREGVEFCACAFGATPVVSHEKVELIPLQDPFDLIWCGSLLTHLDATQCGAFLRFFHQYLGHGGILVFTLHGRFCVRELEAGSKRHNIDDQMVAELLRGYHTRGFSYVNYARQSGYGFSLAHPSFVTANLLPQSPWKLLGYHESGWDKRQDVVSLQKSLNGMARGI
jgi:SAM-dependent methyltransferase